MEKYFLEKNQKNRNDRKSLIDLPENRQHIFSAHARGFCIKKKRSPQPTHPENTKRLNRTDGNASAEHKGGESKPKL